jgi:hypothetical protein
MFSALAVLRLMTSSNLVGWMIGNSAGLSTLEDASGVETGIAKLIGDARSVANQPTVNCIELSWVHCRDFVTCSQFQYFMAIGCSGENCVVTHYERANLLLQKRREGRLEIKTAYF